MLLTRNEKREGVGEERELHNICMQGVEYALGEWIYISFCVSFLFEYKKYQDQKQISLSSVNIILE